MVLPAVETPELNQLHEDVHTTSNRLRALDPDHELLEFSALFKSRAEPSELGSRFIERFTTWEDSTQEEVMVEYLGALEDAVIDAEQAAADSDTQTEASHEEEVPVPA